MFQNVKLIYTEVIAYSHSSTKYKSVEQLKHRTGVVDVEVEYSPSKIRKILDKLGFGKSKYRENLVSKSQKVLELVESI